MALVIVWHPVKSAESFGVSTQIDSILIYVDLSRDIKESTGGILYHNAKNAATI
jgi:hypothetical protein